MIGRVTSVLASLALAACSEPPGAARSARPDTSADEEARLSLLEDEVVSRQGFAFGPADEDGVALGLQVENTRLRTGERLRYRIALSNAGGRPVTRVLWRNFDTGYPERRTRLAVRRFDGSLAPAGGGVGRPLWEGESTPVQIAMELAPGEARARQGNPVSFAAPGTFEVVAIRGGAAFGFEQVSAAVTVHVTE